MSNDTTLRSVFATVLGMPVEDVTDDLAYQGHPKWDSIGHMAIIAGLDAEFDIMIDMDDVIDMSSVGKAREILGKYGVTFAG